MNMRWFCSECAKSFRMRDGKLESIQSGVEHENMERVRCVWQNGSELLMLTGFSWWAFLQLYMHVRGQHHASWAATISRVRPTPGGVFFGRWRKKGTTRAFALWRSIAFVCVSVCLAESINMLA